MRWARVGFGLVGVASVGFVLAITIEPGVADYIPIDPSVARTDRGHLLVAGVGSLALVAVISLLAARAVYGIDQATPPSPESPGTVPTPGDSLDAYIEGDLGMRDRLRGDRAAAVRDRLRSVAIRTVMRTSGVDRETAGRQVERGEWTDDPTARAYLGRRGALPLRTRAVAIVRGESAAQRGARRTAAAIGRIVDRDR